MIREGLVKSFATSAVRPVTGDAGYPRLARRASPGLPSGIAVIVLAVVLGVAYYTKWGASSGSHIEEAPRPAHSKSRVAVRGHPSNRMGHPSRPREP